MDNKQKFEEITKEYFHELIDTGFPVLAGRMLESKWISVEDKLPKNNHWYRVLRNGKHHILPHSCYKGKWYEYGQPFATEDNITHWQPFEDLPQPPNN